jgi:tRNA threonylcarbamoyladenosine biosynthesis protein TsaE
MDSFQLISKNANSTVNIAKSIADCFKLGDVIVLDGNLGTGKTQFVKGFTDALGSSDLVTSPTFTIAQFYNFINGSVLHIDTYRLASVNEFRDTALADFFPTSIVLIEWGSKITDELEDFIRIKFENVAANKNHRSITFSYAGETKAALFQTLKQKLTA